MVARHQSVAAEGQANPRYEVVKQRLRLIRHQSERFVKMREMKGHDVVDGLVSNFSRVLVPELQMLVQQGGDGMKETARREVEIPDYDAVAEVSAVAAQLQSISDVVTSHYGADPLPILRFDGEKLVQVPIDDGLREKLMPELEKLRVLIEPLV